MDGFKKTPIFKALQTFPLRHGIKVALLFSRCQTANADYSRLYAKRPGMGLFVLAAEREDGPPCLMWALQLF